MIACRRHRKFLFKDRLLLPGTFKSSHSSLRLVPSLSDCVIYISMVLIEEIVVLPFASVTSKQVTYPARHKEPKHSHNTRVTDRPVALRQLAVRSVLGDADRVELLCALATSQVCAGREPSWGIAARGWWTDDGTTFRCRYLINGGDGQGRREVVYRFGCKNFANVYVYRRNFSKYRNSYEKMLLKMICKI